MLDIDYILLNNEASLQAVELFNASGQVLWQPKKIFVIQDQIIPPNSPEVSAAQHRLEAFANSHGCQYMYGAAMAGPYLAQELVLPGKVVVGCDKDLLMVGAKGALGLVLSPQELAIAMATGKVELGETENLEISLYGALNQDTDIRNAAMTLVKYLEGKVNEKTIISFQDSSGSLTVDDKMLLCGWCQRLPIRTALFQEQEAAAENGLIFDFSKVKRCVLGDVDDSQEVLAVFLGGSHGGLLKDIRLAADMLRGKQLARKVRLSVAPASAEIYYLAATAGYLTTIMRAGGLVLNQCAVPPIQARIGSGELLVSNDIHDEQDYAGQGGRIMLTDTRTAVELALKGYVGETPEALETVKVQAMQSAAVLETKPSVDDEKPVSFTGRVWRFGDDIDTDIIMPTQHLSYVTMEEIKTHVFEPLRPELAALIQEGDIIVAGNNFGCGSSREQAAEILAFAGIKAVIAKSFARIFFRNAINNGLLLIECPELPDKVSEGDQLTVHINEFIEHKGVKYQIPYLSGKLYELIIAGGLVKSTQKLNGVL